MRIEEYKYELINAINESMDESWSEAVRVLYENWRKGDWVFVAGNGGNHANALHFGTDWNKGLFDATGVPLQTHVAGGNTAYFSALENDMPHNGVIAQQINLLRVNSKISTAVLLSASGKSNNILESAKYCRDNDIFTIGLTGINRPSRETFNLNLHIGSKSMQIVEDCHAIFGHAVYRFIVESNLSSR